MRKQLVSPAQVARLPLFFRCAAPAVLAIAATGAFSPAFGTIVTTTSGVYDEQATQTNLVDQTATSPTSGTVNLVSLATFKNDILTAAGTTGGVIHFDDVAGPVTNETQIDASYGPGNSLVLSLTGTGYQVDMSAATAIGATPISGSRYLRSASATGTQGFTFLTPLKEVGVTVLARSVSRSITATVTYDDNSTGVVGPFTVAANTASTTPENNPGSGPDTFFGFAAPSGRTIKSLSLAAGSNNFFVVDDIGFVTVPEPTSAALLGLAAAGLLTRRRSRG